MLKGRFSRASKLNYTVVGASTICSKMTSMLLEVFPNLHNSKTSPSKCQLLTKNRRMNYMEPLILHHKNLIITRTTSRMNLQE